MEKEDYHKTIELILAYLTGELSEKQRLELESWRKEKKEHEELFQKSVSAENLERYTQCFLEHDYYPKWKEFKQTINRQKRKILVRYTSYAASVILLLTTIFYLSIKEETQNSLPQKTAIMPGSSKAILKIANGKKINIEKPDPDFNRQYANVILKQDTLKYLNNKTTFVPETEIHTLYVPKGGEYFIILSDGTKIWLNSETELTYPINFTEKERKVLLKGEAYFEVTRDTAHPFVVVSGQQTLQVLGTSFGVKAYIDEAYITTTLVSGSVSIENGKEKKLLYPGQQSQVDRDGINVKNVDADLYMAWHKGLFVFIDQPLDEILTTLGRWYNIHIFYTNEKLKQIRFTGEIPRYAQVTGLLKKIEQLEKVRFTIKDKTVTVTTYR